MTPKRIPHCLLVAWTLVGGSALLAAEPVTWSGFRGDHASGVADGFPLPVRWNASTESGDAVNVAWRTPLPGLAHSSPVVWGNDVIVTTAVGTDPNPELKVGIYGSGDSADDQSEHAWLVYCIDRQSGEVRWRREAHRGVPRLKRHTKATHANATPAIAEAHIVAFFGSEGLFCFSRSGELIWRVDLGKLHSGPWNAPGLEWGFASSPIIYKNRVFVQCDVLGQSFVAAFDLKDGKELWRTPRDEVATWSTPTICEVGERPQVVVNGFKRMAGYDLKSGKELWSLSGGGDVPVPTPIVAHDLIYLTNAHGGSAPLLAVKPSARGRKALVKMPPGDNPSIAWQTLKNGAYMQTPVVYRGLVYSCSDRGILKCYDARTGQEHYKKRLGSGGSGFTSSPVAGDGKVYFASEDGDVHVIQAGSKFTSLGTNPLGDICMSTPAIAEGTIFYRTRRELLAVRAP